MKKNKTYRINNFAVIDTETEWTNTQFISVGVVISDKHFNILDTKYFINKNCKNGMYGGDMLYSKKCKPIELDAHEITKEIENILNKYSIKHIFAYNASFDYKILYTLHKYTWHDIMLYARDPEFNKCLTDDKKFTYTKAGKLKKGFGVENMYRLLSGKKYYKEKHIALEDAKDELFIMEHLNKALGTYEKLKEPKIEKIDCSEHFEPERIHDEYDELIEQTVLQLYPSGGVKACYDYLKPYILKQTFLELRIHQTAEDLKVNLEWSEEDIALLKTYANVNNSSFMVFKLLKDRIDPLDIDDKMYELKLGMWADYR